MKASDSWAGFMDLAWETAKRVHGYTDVSECKGAQWGFARVDDKATVGDIFGAIIRGEDKEFNLGFVSWFRRFLAEEIPPDLMRAMLERLAKEEPPIAAALYKDFNGLTDEEDSLIEAEIAKSNLSEIKRQIERGELPRAKGRRG